MLLQSLRVQGLRDAPDAAVSLDGTEVHPLDAPAGTVLADGLALCRAAWCTDDLAMVLGHLQWGSAAKTSWTDEERNEVQGLDPAFLARQLEPDASPRVTVTLQILPDPVLFGRIRGQASRHPDLVSELVSGGAIQVGVSWLLTHDLSVARVHTTALQVGRIRLDATQMTESWVPELLQAIGRRLGRLSADVPTASALAQQVCGLAWSSEPSSRKAFARMQDALQADPFGLPRLHAATIGDRAALFLGDDLQPLRAWGPAAERAVQLAWFGLALAPDVAVVEDGHLWPEAWRAWLAGCLEGDDATLEQILWIDGWGA